MENLDQKTQQIMDFGVVISEIAWELAAKTQCISPQDMTILYTVCICDALNQIKVRWGAKQEELDLLAKNAVNSLLLSLAQNGYNVPQQPTGFDKSKLGIANSTGEPFVRA